MSASQANRATGLRHAAKLPLVRLVCALILTFAVPHGAQAATGATSPASAASAAQPATFVPNWDGETDATMLRVQVRRAGLVTVVARNARGHAVRTVFRGQRARGPLVVSWDGRAANGAVVAPGTYRLAVSVAGVQLANSAVQVALTPLAITDVRVRNAAMSRQFRRPVAVGLRLTRAGLLSAAVVSANGTVLRNLHRGRAGAGPANLTWNGRNDAGAALPDGRYQLLLAGSTGGMPTTTVKIPLVVDSAAPTVAMRRRFGAILAGKALLLRVPLRTSEPAQVTVRRPGVRRAHKVRSAGGKTVLAMNAAGLGIRVRRVATRVPLVVTVVDSAGNTRSYRIVALVPAAKTAPRPQYTPPPTNVPPPSGPTNKLLWPSRGLLVSQFGPRGGRHHAGIDIAAPTGTPIYASADGLVSYSGSQGGYGNLIVVEHPGGLSTAYAHQSQLIAVVGQAVARGQLIGYVGSTGYSSGPHLHFEVRVGGIATNPLAYLPAGTPPS